MAEENKNEKYDRRIEKHRSRVKRIIIIAGVTAVIAVVVGVIWKIRSRFGSFSIVSTQIREESGYTEYMVFGDGFVRYGRDGAVFCGTDGETVWNYSYQLNEPCIDICEGYLVIAGKNDTKAYLFNTDGYVADISTPFPIMQINVSGQGLIVALCDDSEAQHIDMFDKDGNKIFDVKATMDGDGVPVSMAVSDDGEKLVASYTSIDGQKLKTSVVFYNFGEVGQSENERVVGGYDTYGQQIVSRVDFINSDTAVAFGQNIISFYRVGEYPKLLADVNVDYEIKKIFYSEKNVGVVHTDGSNNKIDIFNADGEKTAVIDVPEGYSNFEFAGSDVVMYGDNNVRLADFKGREAFSHTFEDGITEFIPLSDDEEFLYVAPEKVMVIKLRYGG